MLAILVKKILNRTKILIFGQIFEYRKKKNLPFSYRICSKTKVKFYPRGQISIGIYYRIFENDNVKLLWNHIKPGMYVIDVGANIGFYSVVAEKKLNKQGGKVFSFEPSGENYRMLLDNLKLNNCGTYVIPVNMGGGDKIDEQLTLRRDEGYGDAEKYILPARDDMPELSNINPIAAEEKITLTTLDSFADKENIPKVDFIKIDAEGYEYFVLKGAKSILSNNPNIVLLLECTDLGTARAGVTQDEVFDLLKSAGLNIFYWNQKHKKWSDDRSGVLEAGDIWACRDASLLPVQ